MIRNLHLIETRRMDSLVWPSIATASAELRRPRGLTVVRSQPEAVATRRRLTSVPRGR